MANKPALLKQADLTRYIRTLKQEGIEKFCICATLDGSHRITVGEASDTSALDHLDRLLE